MKTKPSKRIPQVKVKVTPAVEAAPAKKPVDSRLMRLYQRLCDRFAEAGNEQSKLDDVVFGTRRLLEAADFLPQGRTGTLTDLQQQIDEAESTHDPTVIQNLMDAMKTFLADEMNEQPEATEEGVGMEAATEAKVEEAKQEEGIQPLPMTYTCEACGHQNGAPAKEAKAEEVKAEAGNPFAKTDEEKKDGENPVIEAKKEESQVPGATSLRETTSEADRRELTILRAGERRRQREARADKVLREAKAEHLFTSAELTPFEESQWPVLISMAQNAIPPRQYGSGQVPSPGPDRKQTPRSAAEVFESHFVGEV